MDNSTAKTLEALAAFVEQQKAVLAQTQLALDQLRRLRSQAAVVPPTDVDQLAEQLNGTAFRLGEQATESLITPENIEWDVFAHKDPRPLVSLGTTARTAYTQRNAPPPPPSQQKPTPTTLTPVPVPPRSSLQHLVRSAKVRLLDPIFALYGEEDPPAHAKHQTHAGTGPVRGPSGLFARREPPKPPPPPSSHADNDREDAMSAIGSGSTTVIDSPSPACHSPPSSSPLQLKPPHKRMKFDYPIKEDIEPMDDVPIALAKPVRARRISTKLARQNDERSEEVGRGRRKVAAATAANSTAAQRVASPVIHKDPPPATTIPAPSITPAAPPRRSTRVSLSISTANSTSAPASTPAVIPAAASPPKPKLVIRLPARSARPSPLLASESDEDPDDEDEDEDEGGSETERGSMTSELSSVGGSSDEDDGNGEDAEDNDEGEEELDDSDSDSEPDPPRVLGKRKRRRGTSPSSSSSLSPPPRKRGRPRKGEMTARDRARRERDRLRKRAKRAREREEREEERREKKARGKATYKVMWSAEEQNHLERLLEEVPASDPRRTPSLFLPHPARPTR
ncbi:hypothetical protein R3P38DRAFT_3348509 [Favolaschia claudopus]|uniref:Uncharacterized protein n=1 Tax=Favolaschia claudopus TaxID=2862362 RepID=A0AAW0CUD8_9AGAR